MGHPRLYHGNPLHPQVKISYRSRTTLSFKQSDDSAPHYPNCKRLLLLQGREKASAEIMAMQAPVDPDTVRERLDELGEELQTVASLVHLSIKNQQHEGVDDAEGAFDCSGDAERKFQVSRSVSGG